MCIQTGTIRGVTHFYKPFREDQEEAVHNGGWGSLGVELADAGNQHGPRHTTQVPQGVGVNALL